MQDNNYMKYLNKSIHLQDQKVKKMRRVSHQEPTYSYIPPHRREANYQSLTISQVHEPRNHNQRSKSFEADLSKKQNTFGLQKSQESNATLVKNVSKEGFISPKFKLQSEEKHKKEIERQPTLVPKMSLVNIENVSEESIQEQSTRELKIQQLQLRLQQKEDQLDIMYEQINQLQRTHDSEMQILRNEKNRLIEQQKKQIELYNQEIKDMRMDLAEVRKENDKLKRRLQKENRDDNSRNKGSDYDALRKENGVLRNTIDKLRQQMMDEFKSCWTTSPLNDSSNMILNTTNNFSTIEQQNKTDISIFEKTVKHIADELNLNDQFNNQININNNILEGVKTLKNQNREQQKFIRCLKDLVFSCAPANFFEDVNEPSLRDMWRFIKQVLNGYLDGKKSQKSNQDIVDQLCKYFVCRSCELIQRSASVIVENEILRRISERVKQMLHLPNGCSINDIDRRFEIFLSKE